MKLQSIDQINTFSVVAECPPHQQVKESGDEALSSKLFFEGSDTGCVIQGVALDRQYKAENYYLFFSNHDCPFEESCEISLVSLDLKLIARRSIGGWYASYWLESVELVGPDQYVINFGGGWRYQLFVNYPRKFQWRFWGWRVMFLEKQATGPTVTS